MVINATLNKLYGNWSTDLPQRVWGVRTDCNRQNVKESAVILSRVVASGTYCLYRRKSKDYCLDLSPEIATTTGT